MAAIDACLYEAKRQIDDEVHFIRGDIVWKLCKMIVTHRKEILFLLFILLATYAAIHSSPLKTKKASFPSPFFSPNSPVKDHSWGDVYRAFELIQYSDVTFIMFYAPWDAASMEVRWEFETTARYYHKQVYFAAVNCWWPNGDCKQHFPKIRSFPILIAYHRNGKGIAFHGTPTFPYLVQFLDQFINPIKAFRDQSDLFSLMAKRDTVILGYFDFGLSIMPDGYLTFYSAALKALEKDTECTIAFAVVTNKIDAANFGLNTSGSVIMHSWNGTLSYKSDASLTLQALLNWVFSNKTQVIKQLTLPCTKSVRLATFLESSTPSLIMMTPRFINTDLDWSPYFYMLKEVALDYFNCNNSDYVANNIQAVRNHLGKMTYGNELSRSYCKNMLRSDCRIMFTAQCCISVASKNQRSARTYSMCVISNELVVSDNLCKLVNDELTIQKEWNHSDCQITFLKYSSFHYLQVCAYTNAYELINHSQRCRHFEYFKCAILNHSDVHLISRPRKRYSEDNTNLTSKGCFNNQTLNFVVIDSLKFGLLLEKIGINVTQLSSKTAIAIIHAKHETYYVLHDELTTGNFRQFILNFTLNELPRYRQSLKTYESTKPSNKESVTVIEVTSSNFNEIIINNDKIVVTLLYAPWCASCFSINHIYLTVARYFQSYKDIIFTRINSESNDLPWELNVQNYPRIFIFPAHRKSDSENFPAELPITTKNLIHFILTHADNPLKINILLSVCTNICITHNRKLAINKISSLLSEYRSLDQQLKQNALAINHGCTHVKIPNTVFNNLENVQFISQKICEVRAKLMGAKSLHFKLSTEETSLSRNNLEKIIEEHNLYLNSSFLHRECQDFVNTLTREVIYRCPRKLMNTFLTMDVRTLL